MSQIKKAIEQIDAATSRTPPCLTEECREDFSDVLQLLKPIKKLLGAPRYHELKREALNKPAGEFQASVPLESFRLASEMHHLSNILGTNTDLFDCPVDICTLHSFVFSEISL